MADKERERCERYFIFIKERAQKLSTDLEAMAFLPPEVKQLIREAMFRNARSTIEKLGVSPDPRLIPELAQILRIVQSESGEYQMSTGDAASSNLPEGFLSNFTNFSI